MVSDVAIFAYFFAVWYLCCLFGHFFAFWFVAPRKIWQSRFKLHACFTTHPMQLCRREKSSFRRVAQIIN
jgi:ABC-type nitrate/sulfonate/bicarbonate transport system permease component